MAPTASVDNLSDDSVEAAAKRALEGASDITGNTPEENAEMQPVQ